MLNVSYSITQNNCDGINLQCLYSRAVRLLPPTQLRPLTVFFFATRSSVTKKNGITFRDEPRSIQKVGHSGDARREFL